MLTTNPVMTDIANVFPATLELATLGTLIGVAPRHPARRSRRGQRGQPHRPGRARLGLVGYSVPIFWLGLMGLLVFYAKLGWVAGPGRLDVAYDYIYTPVTGIVLLDTADRRAQWDAFWTRFRTSSCRPALLGYFSLAYISRMTRSFMLNSWRRNTSSPRG